MQKHLYFICPTDNLEPVINKTFRQENYYCTSLGNSMIFDIATVGQIKELILTKNIEKISFVLSEDNHIVLDTLKNPIFSRIKKLIAVQNQIVQQKEYAELLWNNKDNQALILSYHLQNKIRELKLGLNSLLIDQPQINGKIYHQKNNLFSSIYSELICMESFHFN